MTEKEFKAIQNDALRNAEEDRMILVDTLAPPGESGEMPEPYPMMRSEYEAKFGRTLDLSHLDTLTETDLKATLHGAWSSGRVINVVMVSAAVGRQMAEWRKVSLVSKLLKLFRRKPPVVASVDRYICDFASALIVVKP